MALSRGQVVDTAVALLRRYGLADLSMRRLARELGVAPGALYWHVDSKQDLIVEVAAAVLAQVPEPSPDLPPAEAVAWSASALRAAVASVPDGADVVGLAFAIDPCSVRPLRELRRSVARLVPGSSERTAVVDLVVHHVLGSVAAEQLRRQATVGEGEPDGAPAASVKAFEQGLAVILAGARAHRL